ncbi:hypothetical protein OK016_29100 [Vibrio chagasii]|nr:hypothetical protein [Vibrio chagasii]
MNTIQSQSNNANDLDSVSISIVPFQVWSCNTSPPLVIQRSGRNLLYRCSYRNGDFSAALTVDNLATLHSRRPVSLHRQVSG